MYTVNVDFDTGTDYTFIVYHFTASITAFLSNQLSHFQYFQTSAYMEIDCLCLNSHERRVVGSSMIIRTHFRAPQVAMGFGACDYIVYVYRVILYKSLDTGQDKSRGCAKIVRMFCNFNAVITQFPRSLCKFPT